MSNPFDDPEFREEFFGRRGRPISGEAQKPYDENEVRLNSTFLQIPSAYWCGVCGEQYQSENLQKTCEQTPVEEISSLVTGTVFKCKDDLLAILYESQKIKKQIHKREYKIARTGIHLLSNVDEMWMMIPEVSVDAKYLSHAQPVSDQEFEKVKETLKYHLKDVPQHLANQPHIVKLRELTLISLK